MTTTAIAVHDTTTALAITPGQKEFTDAQVAVLQQLGIEDAPKAQQDLFFHQCQHTGLDPFRKQIYMIGRKTKVGGYRGEPERYETKWTIQTGIDGYRLNGRRAARATGSTVKKEGPFFIGIEGGEWSKVWLNPKQPPAAARFVIYRDGDPYEAVCHYWEFVQTTGFGENQRANSQWSKMPAHMLGKCAEVLAWRYAFEDEFSGLNFEGAAQVVDADPEPVQRKSDRGDQRQALREQLGVVDDESVALGLAADDQSVEDAAASESSAEPEASQVAEPKITATQRKKLFAAMEEGGVGTAAEGLAWINDTLGRGETNAIKSTADVPKAELQKLFDELDKSQGPAEDDSTAEAGAQTAIGDES